MLLSAIGQRRVKLPAIKTTSIISSVSLNEKSLHMIVTHLCLFYVQHMQ